MTIGGSRGPQLRQKFRYFNVVFWKIGQIVGWHPPLENPRYTTNSYQLNDNNLLLILQEIIFRLSKRFNFDINCSGFGGVMIKAWWMDTL